MDDIPPDIQHDVLLDGASYAERLEYFRKKSEELNAQSDTFLFTGHGYSIKVSHDALSLQQGSTRGEVAEPTLLYRGVHNIRLIVLLSTSGSISIAALRWCKSQGISILMIDELGDLLYSLFPESSSSVRLRRLQYQAADKSGIIARELKRRREQWLMLEYTLSLNVRRSHAETFQLLLMVVSCSTLSYYAS